MISYMWNLKNAELVKKKENHIHQGLGVGENGQTLIKGYELSVIKFSEDPMKSMVIIINYTELCTWKLL